MKIKAKRIFVNLKNFSPKGSLLDISHENSGIIYNITKHNKNKVEFQENHKDGKIKYDNCAIFFVLSLISKTECEGIIEDLKTSLNENGELYIWDRVKEKGEFIRDEVVASLPDGSNKSFSYMNLNPFPEFNIENIEKILEKNFEITETIIWDKIIYLKAKKKGTIQDESIISGDKLKIHT